MNKTKVGLLIKLLEKETGKKIGLKEGPNTIEITINKVLELLKKFDEKTERTIISKLLIKLKDRKYDLTFSLNNIINTNLTKGSVVKVKAMNSNEWEEVTVIKVTKNGLIATKKPWFIYASLEDFKGKKYYEIKTSALDLKQLDYKSYEK